MNLDIRKGKTVMKSVMGLFMAVLLGGLPGTPAFADPHDNGDGRDWHGDRGRHRGHDRGEDRRHWRDYRQPYGYEQPVYVPPPVYYPPQPAPGLNIFIPLNLR